jgi:hypothetical protein
MSCQLSAEKALETRSQSIPSTSLARPKENGLGF